jgi:flagellar protein FliS
MALPNQEYLKTSVLTASPEMLTLMLWDGAIRFAEQGKDAILRKDIEGSYKALVRSQRIVTELITTLRHDVEPQLCARLSALYNFIHHRLVDANVQKNPQCVDDALEIMRHQRETWAMLMDKLTKDKAVQAQQTVEANADAITGAPATSSVAATVPMKPGAPARRGYPAFAVRPAAAATTLSVQG